MNQTKNEITVRRFLESDLIEVISLFRETIHSVNIKDYTQDQVNAWAPSNIPQENWLTSLMQNRTFIAESSTGKIVGFGDLEESGYLDRLYVHKDFQGLGIASKLLIAIEQEAVSLSLKEIHAEASITAKPFFEARGFECEKKQNKEYRGESFINFIMKKRLSE